MRPKQLGLLQNLLPKLSVPDGTGIDADTWPQAQQLWVEIGIGGGEHFVFQATNNPDVQLIGFEPFQNGMAKALGSVAREELRNVSLEMQDARTVLERFADASIDRLFILYPDPWPKRRHWKRRIITPDFVTELARLLKPGAELRFVSDIAHYQQWALR
ncbi:tRNA (guanine(46)-N(7))-methyltransferase, partial [hydrothermal vent metagenome]